MALTRLSNQSLTSVTSLPAAISTGKISQIIQSTNSYQKSSSSTSLQDIESSSGTVWEPAITLSSASSKLYVLEYSGL